MAEFVHFVRLIYRGLQFESVCGLVLSEFWVCLWFVSARGKGQGVLCTQAVILSCVKITQLLS